MYRPENIREIDKHHREITHKSCALSAKADELTTIKRYLLNAARKQGLIEDTDVTALADGAANCWSAISSLDPHCHKLTCILDWFHIGMKFQNVRNALGETLHDSLDSVKWTLWHGNSEEALTKLELLMENISVDKKRSKLKGLYDYLKRNQDYLVNYDERKEHNQTYTSQVAESGLVQRGVTVRGVFLEQISNLSVGSAISGA